MVWYSPGDRHHAKPSKNAAIKWLVLSDLSANHLVVVLTVFNPKTFVQTTPAYGEARNLPRAYAYMPAFTLLLCFYAAYCCLCFLTAYVRFMLRYAIRFMRVFALCGIYRRFMFTIPVLTAAAFPRMPVNNYA